MICPIFHCTVYVVILSVATVNAVEKGDLLINYEKQTPDSVLVTCAYCGDEQEPRMVLMDKDSDEIRVNTFVSNIFDSLGQCYLVNMQLLMMDAFLPKQMSFECVLKDTATGEEKRKTIDYTPSSSIRKCSSLRLVTVLPIFALSFNVVAIALISLSPSSYVLEFCFQDWKNEESTFRAVD